jgi:hypothetical protein
VERCRIGRTGYSPDFCQRPEWWEVEQFCGDNLVLHELSEISHSKGLEHIVAPAASLHDNQTPTVTAATDESTGLGHGVDRITTRLFARPQ